MSEVGHPITLAGRVNADELARVDAAARLRQQPRAHFVVEATLEMAAQVIQEAAAEPPVLVERPV